MKLRSRKRGIAAPASLALLASAIAVPLLGFGAPATAATASGVTFTCDVPLFENSFAWTTDVTVTAERVVGASTATLTAKTSALSGFTIPLVVTDMKMNGTMAVTAGSASANLTGSSTIAILGIGDPIGTPALRGSVAVAGSSVDVTVKSLDFATHAMGTDVAVNCVPDAAITVAGVGIVDVKPAVVAKATTSTTKVTYAKKAKKATIVTTVKAGKANATGKVKIVVKKGKKAVVTKTLALKKGKVRLVLKKAKLKKKGKYVVNTTFQKNKKFKKSTSKANFTVK